jgi:hypothetical protein
MIEKILKIKTVQISVNLCLENVLICVSSWLICKNKANLPGITAENAGDAELKKYYP